MKIWIGGLDMGISAVRRKNGIVSMLEENGEVSVSQFVDAFKVSEVTIRRDLESLEEKGLLLRTYGGAVRRDESKIANEFLYGEKAKRNISEKKAIARAAFEYIRPNETIFLDSGTTTLEIARLIKNSGKDLTIVTNSFPMVLEIFYAENTNIFLLGGFLRKNLYDFNGPFLKDDLKGLSFSKAFLGVDGISGKSGLTTTDQFTVLLEEAAMESAHEVIIVADSSKVGKISLLSYGKSGSSAPRTLITDSGASPGEIEEIKKLGFKIKIVEVEI
jgi:DeoR/GlpR family transcriptional regulator of sugar metabolism